MIKVKLYLDKERGELCVVFYEGNAFTLYKNFIKDVKLCEIVETIKRGLKDKVLISLDTRSFKERKKYLYTLEVTL